MAAIDGHPATDASNRRPLGAPQVRRHCRRMDAMPIPPPEGVLHTCDPPEDENIASFTDVVPSITDTTTLFCFYDQSFRKALSLIERRTDSRYPYFVLIKGPPAARGAGPATPVHRASTVSRDGSAADRAGQQNRSTATTT